MSATRRTVICPCGGDIYYPEYDAAMTLVWRCANCAAVTPRKRINRKTNHRRGPTCPSANLCKL